MNVTVLIDRNEQRPLIFPATIKWFPDRGDRSKIVVVRTKEVTLRAGDYALEGSERCCLVERKACLDELAKNLLSDDYTRAIAAFERFAGASDNPYLLLECTASELRRETRWTKQPERIVDALAALIQRLKLRLILCGSCKTPKQKRVVGELLLRLMMAHTFHRGEDYGMVSRAIGNLGRDKDSSGGTMVSKEEVEDEDETREREGDVRDGGTAGHVRGQGSSQFDQPGSNAPSSRAPGEGSQALRSR